MRPTVQPFCLKKGLCMNKTLIIIFIMIGIFMNGNAVAGYEEGQVWKYKTRAGEEESLLYIVKIDEVKGYGKHITFMLMD